MTKPDLFADAQREDWMTDELLEKVRNLAQDGRLDCAQAQQFAQETSIPLKQMRAMLDVLQFKVSNCQLGCF